MTLGRFGVEISLEPHSNLKVNSEDKRGDSLSVTYKTLSLVPGNDYSDAAKITFGGTPNVDTRITIDVQITYNTDDFTIYKTDFNNLATESMICVPIGFESYGASKPNANHTTNPLGYTLRTVPYSSNTAAETEQYIEEDACARISGAEYENGVIYRDYSANTVIPETTLTFGFAWTKNISDYPILNPNNLANTDEIGTWMANKFADTAIPISVTYIIKAEQIT